MTIFINSSSTLGGDNTLFLFKVSSLPIEAALLSISTLGGDKSTLGGDRVL
jgi:hypothetical protein